jgi:D-alanyl-D-alanine carboxypeptidase
LGVDVLKEQGHRALEHGGEVSGFTSKNIVLPDDRAAIVVLMNQDSVNVSDSIARRILPLLFSQASTAQEEEKARAIFEQLQQGKIDRSQFTDDCNAYFSEQALRDFASGMQGLGKPPVFVQRSTSERGGMTFRLFTVNFSTRNVDVWERVMPDGKIEQFQVMAAD